MKKLLVTDREQNKLGEIGVNETGEIVLSVLEEKYRPDLEQLVSKISQEPVYLRGGGNDGTGMVTTRKQVTPQDEDFLSGVQEMLNKVSFGDVRVRGFVTDHEA